MRGLRALRDVVRAREDLRGDLIVATRTELRAITEAKVKADRRDARTLARLLAAGLLHGRWLPDETTRALRRPWRAARSWCDSARVPRTRSTRC